MNVYGFDHLEFVSHIKNYKDTGHYHPKFNMMILSWMQEKKYQLSLNNLDTYIETITDQSQRYDVVSIGDKIKKHLK